MKRKEKSGHEKCLESKRRSLREAASATGQKSLLTFLKKDSDVSATEKPAKTRKVITKRAIMEMIYQLLIKTYRLLPRKFKQAAGTKGKN